MAFPANPSIGQTYTARIRISNQELKDVGIVTGMAHGVIAGKIKPLLQKKVSAALGSTASKFFTPIFIACEAIGFYGYILQALNRKGVEITMGFKYKRIEACQQGACYYYNDWTLNEGIRITTY